MNREATQIPALIAPIGVGFIGSGFMASVHSRAARAARARLVGVVSSCPERSRAATGHLGIERHYDDVDAMLNDDEIDVVHVCTPNALHAEQALAVIAAGKHVVCEKPLAISAAEAEYLVKAAAAAGVTATVPFVYRFHPLVREARARVALGITGRLLSIHGSYLQDWLLEPSDDNWRVDSALGGASRAFADIGSHLVDLVEFVSGDRIVRLAATKRTFFTDRREHSNVSTEDAVAITLQTHGGAIGTLLVSQAAPGRKNRLLLEIAGTAESLAFNQENPDQLWIGRRTGSELLLRDEDQLHTDARRLVTVPAGHPQGYLDAFTAFVADSYDAMAGGTPEGLPRFDDGLRAARIVEAVIEASESAQWIDIKED